MFSFHVAIYLGLELLSHKVIVCLTIWGNVRLFFKAATSFNNHTSRVRVTISSHPGKHLLMSALFDSSHPSGCEVVSHCGFDLYFLDD